MMMRMLSRLVKACRRLFGRNRVRVRNVNQYALVGFVRKDDGSLDHMGRVGLVCLSYSWAQAECRNWNESQEHLWWYVAIIPRDVLIYGKTGLSDE